MRPSRASRASSQSAKTKTVGFPVGLPFGKYVKFVVPYPNAEELLTNTRAPAAAEARIVQPRLPYRVTPTRYGRLPAPMSDANIAAQVGAFYERHPYPPPIDDLKTYRQIWDDRRRRADSHLFWPSEPYRDDRSVLIAGCGTSQA